MLGTEVESSADAALPRTEIRIDLGRLVDFRTRGANRLEGDSFDVSREGDPEIDRDSRRRASAD